MSLPTMPRLGFGLMRLPKKSDGKIDIEAVKQMVDSYMSADFNYFDTAYVYDGGDSERAVKSAITERYPRESFMVATKLPAWAMKDEGDRDRIFNEQLERCGVDYFDSYLLHSLEDGANYDAYEEYNCFEWAAEKKAAGKIRRFGFSYHGSPELLERVLDKHPETEFVQIQLNWADWNNQVVRAGALYKILHRRGIPIIVMEPCKGGMLANLEQPLASVLKAVNPDASLASWAFRFAGSLEGVVTVLSGMSTYDQMADNLNTFRAFKPLSDAEHGAIDTVVKKMQDMPLVQCTSCRYCCAGCPMSISIPDIFRALNTARLYPKDGRPKMFYANLLGRGSGKASDCIECRQCESVCPQHLPITDLLKEAAGVLE